MINNVKLKSELDQKNVKSEYKYEYEDPSFYLDYSNFSSFINSMIDGDDKLKISKFQNIKMKKEKYFNQSASDEVLRPTGGNHTQMKSKGEVKDEKFDLNLERMLIFK